MGWTVTAYACGVKKLALLLPVHFSRLEAGWKFLGSGIMLDRSSISLFEGALMSLRHPGLAYTGLCVQQQGDPTSESDVTGSSHDGSLVD